MTRQTDRYGDRMDHNDELTKINGRCEKLQIVVIYDSKAAKHNKRIRNERSLCENPRHDAHLNEKMSKIDGMHGSSLEWWKEDKIKGHS